MELFLSDLLDSSYDDILGAFFYHAINFQDAHTIQFWKGTY